MLRAHGVCDVTGSPGVRFVPLVPYYEDSAVRLYHGDCRDILPQLEAADHVITDPPYGDATHSNAASNRGIGHAKKAIDFAAINDADVASILRILGPKCGRWFVATMQWQHIAALELATPEPWEFVRFGVWVKTNPMPQLSADRPAHGWDGIAYLHNKAAKKRWRGGGEHGNWIGPVVTNGLHPTGKPEAFVERLVTQFTDDGDLILDPFSGSGTTAVVAKRMGRRCIAIELDDEACRVTNEVDDEMIDGDLAAEVEAIRLEYTKLPPKLSLGNQTAVHDSMGAGSPEGVVVASPGSTYRRTNGGAGTSFYVKETGTGNTGWFGK